MTHDLILFNDEIVGQMAEENRRVDQGPNSVEYFGDLAELIHPSWYDTFTTAKTQLEFVCAKLLKEVATGEVIYPPVQNMLRSFLITPLDSVRCVIVGQDPYYGGDATGVAFSGGREGVPESLKNIVKEVRRCYPHKLIPDLTDPCIEGWSQQGVLLINSSFSVSDSTPGGHRGRWLGVITRIIDSVVGTSSVIPWMLWGAKAKLLEHTLEEKGASNIWTCGHPSPRSVYLYREHGQFVMCDDVLIASGWDPINWSRFNPIK